MKSRSDVRDDDSVMLADLAATREWALIYEKSREHDFTIGPEHDPQVHRWWVVPRNPVSNVYLHRFYRSDDDRALHDYPWDNVSWLLSGEYLEHLGDGSTITRHEGDVVRRAAADPHRVELVTGPVLSLFFTGPIIRSWGFYCPNSWRHWREFVSTYPGGNLRGRGCE